MRYKYLDNIRGIASLIIVFSHIVQLFVPFLIYGDALIMHSQLEKIFLRFPFTLFYNGNAMVYLFMIIGGFVTAKSCMYQNKGSLKKKIINRYIRLAVPIFITTVIIGIMLSMGTNSYNHLDNYTYNYVIKFDSEAFSLIEAGKYAFWDVFFQPELFRQSTLSYNHVLWTIHIEFASSLMLYVVYSLMKKSSIRVGCLILLMATSHMPNKTLYMIYFIGAIIAEMHSKLEEKTTLNQLREKVFEGYWKILFLVSLILLGYPYVQGDSIIYGTVYQNILKSIIAVFDETVIFKGMSLFQCSHFIGAVILLGVVVFNESAQRIWNKKLLIQLGRLSYSIYLIHWSLLLILVASILSILKEKVTYYQNLSICIVIFFGALMIGAHMIYKVSHWIDRKLSIYIYKIVT